MKQLAVRARFIEGDHVGQSLHRSVRAQGREVGVQTGLELVEQHLVRSASEGRAFDEILDLDQLGAASSRSAARFSSATARTSARRPEQRPRHADPRSFERPVVERLRVVGSRPALSRRRRLVARIDSGQSAQQNRPVAHRAAHRPGGVLRV